MDGTTAHLDEAVRADLLLPDDRRIARIDRDRWIGYGRAREIIAELDRILCSERRQRPDNLLVIGASNQATWCHPPYVIAESWFVGGDHLGADGDRHQWLRARPANRCRCAQ